jgi:hypothetical protein
MASRKRPASGEPPAPSPQPDSAGNWAGSALPPASPAELLDLAYARAVELREAVPPASLQGADERKQGFCLSQDGAWELWPQFPDAVAEMDEAAIPAEYDERSVESSRVVRRAAARGGGGALTRGRQVRTLTNFALYDQHGRMVGVEVRAGQGVSACAH